MSKKRQSQGGKQEATPEKKAKSTPEDSQDQEELRPDIPPQEAATEGGEGENPEPQILEAPPPEDDRLIRLAAEYDNFRKRTIKEKVTLRDEALRQTALAFLPVYDNLDRALKQETADEPYKKGVEMTMNQLKEILSSLEVEKIPSVGELFDPNYHEAVTHVDDERWGENTVTEVFQEGFTHKEKVIRFAMVKVAN